MILGMITLPARPAPLEVDPSRTAALVIDMQNDFGSTGGMFDRAGVDISAIRAAVPPTRRVLDACRRTGIPVVYVTMQHPADLANAGPEDGPHLLKHRPLAVGEPVVAPDGSEGAILVEGTWNTRIVDELSPRPGEAIVSKHRYSGFFETRLNDVLVTLDAKYLLVTGCTTSICVESTVRDAMFRDYSCVVLEDCTAEPLGAATPRTNHEASLLNIEVLFGWISSSEAVVSALGAERALEAASH